MIAALLLYCSACQAQAQQQSHIPRVGLLATGDQFDDGSERFDAFKEELSKLGYTAGSNIIRSARTPTEQSPKLVEAAKELISLPVDVLVPRSTTEALAVQKLKTTVPIIFWSSEPVAGSRLQAPRRVHCGRLAADLLHQLCHPSASSSLIVAR
jgi:ABC-type uncharacterized transport system substrate-binding protein